jgi:hypothetical protein
VLFAQNKVIFNLIRRKVDFFERQERKCMKMALATEDSNSKNPLRQKPVQQLPQMAAMNRDPRCVRFAIKTSEHSWWYLSSCLAKSIHHFVIDTSTKRHKYPLI